MIKLREDSHTVLSTKNVILTFGRVDGFENFSFERCEDFSETP